MHNYITTVIFINLQFSICRGPLEQQCIRYLTSNVFGSGPMFTDTMIVRPVFFCQISSGELSTASVEGNARLVVVDEQRRRQVDDVSYLCVF